jgi:hypothetical protein
MPNTQPYYVMVVEKQKDTGVETRSHILTIAATNTKAALLLACNQFDTVKDTSGISRDMAPARTRGSPSRPAPQ